jgi:HPt (histidine-containing phosphotransfer) domain-containing protein
MSDAVDRAFHALQLEYLASMPARLEELRSDVAALRAGDPAIGPALEIRLHRLAGSGGSYGFAQLSSIARKAERWLADHREAAELDQLEEIIDRLAREAEEAGKRVSG